MTIIKRTWQLHTRAKFRSIRSGVSLLTAGFFLFIYTQINDARFDTNFLLIGLSYIATLLFIVVRCLNGKNLHITVANGNVVIPRAVFPDKIVALSDIKSIENHFNSKGVIAISLGRENNNSIIIDKGAFETSDDFKQFAQFMSDLIRHTPSGKSSEETTLLSIKGETRRHISTGLISVIFLLVYIYTAGSDLESIKDYMAAQGGLTKETIDYTQIYRLASSFFLHLTPMHLGFNVLALAIFGRYVDVIFGTTKFLNLLFFSALSGSILSWMFSPYDLVLGASGGISGLLGTYFIALRKYKKFLPGSVRLPNRTVYFLLTLQVIIDVSIPRVDILSHIGGFLFGLFYATWSTRNRSASQASATSAKETLIANFLVFSYVAGLFYFLTISFLRHH